MDHQTNHLISEQIIHPSSDQVSRPELGENEVGSMCVQEPIRAASAPVTI